MENDKKWFNEYWLTSIEAKNWRLKNKVVKNLQDKGYKVIVRKSKNCFISGFSFRIYTDQFIWTPINEIPWYFK